MRMRYTRKIFWNLETGGREISKDLEGVSHSHIPLRFFEITGLFRESQCKKQDDKS